MDLTPYVSGLREDLTAAAAAGDDQTRQTAGVLAAALEPAARLAIMNALSDLAAEVTAALDDRVVELRLTGRDVRVAVHRQDGAPPGPPPPPEPPAPGGPFAGGPFPEGGDVSRITLRLFDQLKGQAERAAAQQGVSLNAWLSQAVQGALADRFGEGGPWAGGRHGAWAEQRQGRNRVQGWVQG